jgi:hypothetical protein
MASELIAHNVVSLSLAKANRRKSDQKGICARCGGQIGPRRDYVRGNDCGVTVLFHRRCFLTEMRDCCALA